MRHFALAAILAFATSLIAQEPDAEIARHIDSIKAIDNHAHVIAADPADKGFDQLRCEMLPDSGVTPASWRYNADWMSAIHALYGFTPKDSSDAEMKRVDDARAVAMQQHGDQQWVLDKAGIATVLANRTELAPEMKAPRVLWVPYEDALLVPLNNSGEKSVNPDRKALFEMAEHLQSRYLEQAGMKHLPLVLDDYLNHVVLPTLERQRKAGAVAIKFEVAYVRALDFAEVDPYRARQVYAKYAGGSIPQAADYKLLQDYLFKQIALEAGKLGMPVHIHTGSGCGSFFNDPGSDAFLLSPMLNDPDLRKTNFVLLHGNYPQHRKLLALIVKPNVYVDTSVVEYFLTPREYGDVLKSWLEQMPEHVIFGTDASPGSPGQNWPEATLWGTAKVRRSLAIALTEMVKEGSIDKARALEIADLVLRGNASELYGIK